MKRIIWLSDIHLNFLTLNAVRRFTVTVRNHKPDLLLLGGDTSDARYLVTHLQLLETELEIPIYFVLGNHDFYHSSFSQVKEKVINLTQSLPYLRWLTKMDVVELTPTTALLGHDSWADGRYGDYYNSSLLLNDYFLIAELTNLNRATRLQMLRSLGDAAASHFKKLLPLACQAYREILLLTHVPPFREACWHEGEISDDDGLPHFSCKAVGEVLLEVMQVHPECNLTVLCGHTHSRGEARILPNLSVFTGGAEYGNPQVQRVFEVD